MTEEIKAILETDIIVSRERGLFSTPTEIQNHLNLKLDSAYSTKAIAECLKLLGWKVSGRRRIKRKGKACNFYYRQGDIESKALLSPKAKTNTQSETQSKDTSSESGESLSSIDKRFRAARADKERHLASTRSVEVNSAKHREKHLELELQKERAELISKSEVQRTWERAIVYMKTNLYTLPERFSQRWASEGSEEKIYEEFVKELDALLNRFAQDGERVVTGENEEDFTTDEQPDAEREARG